MADAGRLLPIRRRLARVVLAVLLLDANRPVTLERLADQTWAQPPRSAVANLRSYLSQLRTLLGRIESGPAGYLVRVRDGELDATVFDGLVADGSAALRAGRYPLAIERLTRAMGLWRGDVLAGVAVPRGALAEVARLDELRLSVAEDIVDARLALGEHRDLLPQLTADAERDPLRERRWAQLMLARYRSGRVGDALAAYRRAATVLADELGADPGLELQELHGRVLRADPALDVPSPSVEIPARRPPAQLPISPTLFTGRDRELAEILGLAGREHPASATVGVVDGMAGVGKTALALRAAHLLAADHPDGHLYLDLHGYTDGTAPLEPAVALDRMLRSLAVPGDQIPARLDDRAAMYRTTLAATRTLIVLDNAGSEEQVRPLLPGAPGCLALITSRGTLAGLDPDATISLDVLPVAPATELFVRVIGAWRAAAEPPALLAEIVELCGRLPLAIRIVASRVRARSGWNLTHAIERLREQQGLAEFTAGGRSLAAALDLTYRQLEPAARHAYRMLGDMPGPDLASPAVAALLGTTVERARPLLDALLDTHLLQEPTPDRYRFHDLVRRHARSVGDNEPDRHPGAVRLAEHYTSTASAATNLVQPDGAGTCPPRPETTGRLFETARRAEEWLDTELGNTVAVASRAAADGRGACVLQLAATVQRYLQTRGHFYAGRILQQQAVDAARVLGDQHAELVALLALGDILRMQGLRGDAENRYRDALALAEDLGDRGRELSARVGLGDIQRLRGDRERAVSNLGSALRIAGEIDDRGGELAALLGLGHLHRSDGRDDEAEQCFRRALDAAKGAGRADGEGAALAGLGYLQLAHRRLESAADSFQRALAVARGAGHRSGEMTGLLGIGDVERARHRYQRAISRYAQVLQIARDIGNRNMAFEALHGLGRAHHAGGDPAYAVTFLQQALGTAVELDQPRDQAAAHDGLARSHHAMGRTDLARRHWRRALDILTGIGAGRTEDVRVDDLRAELARLDGAAPVGS